jgi:pimeloyl-ACP methyl ester carboxylesterase
MPPIGKGPISSSHASETRRSHAPPKAIPVREDGPSGFASDRVTLSQEALNGSAASINEEREQALLKANGGRGFAVPIHQGSRHKPVTLTVHGINGSPDSVKSLSDAAARRGESVSTFVYNDQKGSLTDSSQDLAKAIADLRKKHPGQTLNIASHSMGSRISADALRRLNDQKTLTGKIQQQMYGPMIGGNGMANTAKMAPKLLDGMLAGLKPGREMGTNSSFQKTLETTALPSAVKTQIFVGDNDQLVDPKNPHFQWVADGLNARVSTIAGADHTSVLEQGNRRR